MSAGSKINIENILIWAAGIIFGFWMLFSGGHLGAYEYSKESGRIFVGNRMHAWFGHEWCTGWIAPALGIAFLALLISFFAWLVYDEGRRFFARRKKFFQDHGSDPMSRAAFAKIDTTKQGLAILMVSCCAFLPFLIFVLRGTDDSALMDRLLSNSVEFMVVTVIFALVGLVFWGCIFLIEGPFKKSWIKIKAKISRMVSDETERSYQQLPSAEKLAATARASKLGVDPEDKNIRRAAVADYNQRMKAASAQASQLAAATSQLDRKASTRRL